MTFGHRVVLRTSAAEPKHLRFPTEGTAPETKVSNLPDVSKVADGGLLMSAPLRNQWPGGAPGRALVLAGPRH